jgi:hypothetical protein
MNHTPERNPLQRPDGAWSDLVAAMAVHELIAGKVIRSDQADFAKRIVQQQIFIMLISGCRPFATEIP